MCGIIYKSENAKNENWVPPLKYPVFDILIMPEFNLPQLEEESAAMHLLIT